MAATWKQVDQKAREIGATAEMDDFDAYVYSPERTTWNDTGSSVLSVPFANSGGQSWKPKAFSELLDRMNSGVSDDPDADGWWVDDE